MSDSKVLSIIQKDLDHEENKEKDIDPEDCEDLDGSFELDPDVDQAVNDILDQVASYISIRCQQWEFVVNDSI